MILLANLIALFHGMVLLPSIIIAPLIILFSKKRLLRLEKFFLFFGILTWLSFIFLGSCFLTTWEQNLRTAAGIESYTGGFVSHYFGKIGIHFPDYVTTIVLTSTVALGFMKIIWNQLKKKK